MDIKLEEEIDVIREDQLATRGIVTYGPTYLAFNCPNFLVGYLNFSGFSQARNGGSTISTRGIRKSQNDYATNAEI